MTEASLIERACEGDGRAVRTLYERYAPRVYAVVRRIAGDDELARDYAQEALDPCPASTTDLPR